MILNLKILWAKFLIWRIRRELHRKIEENTRLRKLAELPPRDWSDLP